MSCAYRKLTPKQQKFVTEYLVDLNATQAAIRAGYSPKRADAIGWENLRKPQIEQAITAIQAEQVKDTKVTKAWIAAEAQATYRQARELRQPAAARGALELLARLHGHITEKRETRVIKSLADLTDEELASLGADTEREEGTRH
jgi:hypothetical protein